MAEESMQAVVSTQEVLTVLLQDTLVRQHVLTDPILSTALAQHAQTVSQLDCTDVQLRLPTYLDAQQQGTADGAAYQQLALHVHQCPVCFDLYQESYRIIQAQSRGILPLWPGPDAPVGIGEAYHLLTLIVLARPELRQLMTACGAECARGDTDQALPSRLLYAGTAPGWPDLFARVLLRPMDVVGADWQIDVALVQDRPLPPLLVMLRCGQESRAAMLDDRGAARFVAVPPNWFVSESAPDLLVVVGQVSR